MRKEVENQELTVQDAEQLDIEISDLKGTLLDLKRKREDDEKKLDETRTSLVDKFIAIEKALAEDNRNYDQILDKLPNADLNIKMPVLDRNAFFEYLNKRKGAVDNKTSETLWRMTDFQKCLKNRDAANLWFKS